MMNERIKELANQVGLGVQHNGIVLTKNVEASQAFEQFAELLIKECGIVGDYWVDNEDNGKNLVSDKLKQHFGVQP